MSNFPNSAIHRIVKTGIFGIAVATAAALGAPEARAGTMYNGWNYAIDSPNDSIMGDGNGGHDVGNTIYEIYSMAFKADNDHVWVALNSNLPIEGRQTGPKLCNGSQCFDILNNSITWGDIFFDFSGKPTFPDGGNMFNMFGIRFAESNDSGAPELGVYPLIESTMSVVQENAGWGVGNHNSKVKANTGVNSSLGDLAWNDPYYNGVNYMPNVIGSVKAPFHNPVALEFLTLGELQNDGLDWGAVLNPPNIGSETIGFKFDRHDSLFPRSGGEFIATAFLECFNDGIALKGELEPIEVPEPEMVMSFAVLAILFGFNGMKKLRSA